MNDLAHLATIVAAGLFWCFACGLIDLQNSRRRRLQSEPEQRPQLLVRESTPGPSCSGGNQLPDTDESLLEWIHATLATEKKASSPKAASITWLPKTAIGRIVVWIYLPNDQIRACRFTFDQIDAAERLLSRIRKQGRPAALTTLDRPPRRMLTVKPDRLAPSEN